MLSAFVWGSAFGLVRQRGFARCLVFFDRLRRFWVVSRSAERDQGLCPMDPAAFKKAGETFALQNVVVKIHLVVKAVHIVNYLALAHLHPQPVLLNSFGQYLLELL